MQLKSDVAQVNSGIKESNQGEEEAEIEGEEAEIKRERKTKAEGERENREKTIATHTQIFIYHQLPITNEHYV
jgi:hypothetical protein